MSRATERTVLERLRRSLQSRLAQRGDDGGFMLVEVMIALSLITVIMAAVGVEYVSGVANTAYQRALTNATQVTSTALSEVRSLDPSDLLKGRTQTAVTAERDALRAIPRVQPWVSGDATRLAYNDDNQANYANSIDNSTSGSATLRVPVPTQPAKVKPASVEYKVYKYIECSITVSTVTNPKVKVTDPTTTQRNCSPASRSNVTGDGDGDASYLRVIVASVWSARGCPSAGCAFVTSTLIDGHANPTFDLNQKLPAAPVVTQPGDQAWAIDDSVSLQLLVKDNTGVTPFTWTLVSGSLPNLSLSTSGLISGTVAGGTKTSTAVTVKVTDAFLREATATFNYTVAPKLVPSPNPIPDKASTTAETVNTTVSATGGAGAPFTFSDPSSTLPTGLTLASNGTISGRPTRAGVYTVSLQVADKSVTRTAPVTFTWTITSPPIALTNPGMQVSTRGTADSVQLSAGGGSGSYSYAATSLPTGLTINASTGLISGTPTANNSGANVTATATDTVQRTSQQVTFTWKVVDPPTVASPGNQVDTQNAPVSVPVTFSCSNTPCSFAVSGAPTNVTIDSSSGILSGTPSAIGSSSPTITIKDNGGATSTARFTWNIVARPSVTTGASTYVTAVNAAPSTPVAWTCPNTPCTLTVATAVPGVGLSTASTSNSDLTASRSLTLTDPSGTVYLTGHVQDSAAPTGQASSTDYQTLLTLKDADAVTDTETDKWTARQMPFTTWPYNTTQTAGAAVSGSYDAGCATNASSCQIALTGAPSGIGLSSTRQTSANNTTSGTLGNGDHYVTGRIATNAQGTYRLVLTVTQVVAGVTTSVSSYGTWTVT